MRVKSIYTFAGGAALAAGIVFSAAACAKGSGNEGNAVAHADVQQTIAQFKQQVPRTAQLFENAYGYVVFPGAGAGALVVGPAHGGGEIYRRGDLVGHVTMTRFAAGPESGGEVFREVIFFPSARAFNAFTIGGFRFGPDATAAAGTAGMLHASGLANGVLVFVISDAGPVPGADIGGQAFRFTPMAAQGPYGAGASAGAAAAAAQRSAEADSAHHRPLKLSDVKATVVSFIRARPGIVRFFNNAYGYAVFPTIGKGGFIIGGAFGGGAVFRRGELAGYATVTNFSIGAQIGGKTFSEVIFFQTEKAFDRFTTGHFQFGSSAISIGVPAASTAEGAVSTLASAYSERGVAVFTLTKTGFMVGVNVGGQKFSFTPVSELRNAG